MSLTHSMPAAAAPEAQKMISAMLTILLAALMHLHAQKLKRQYYISSSRPDSLPRHLGLQEVVQRPLWHT